MSDEAAQPAAEETPAPPAPAAPETPAPAEPQEATPEAAPEPLPELPPSRAESAGVASPGLPAATVQLRERALAARQARGEERRESILALARHKKSITNNDVELHTHVSDATATRDLEQLVKDGRLKRVGKQGRPTYEPA